MEDETLPDDFGLLLNLLSTSKNDHAAYLVLEKILSAGSLDENPSFLQEILTHDLSSIVKLLDSNFEVCSTLIINLVSDLCQQLLVDAVHNLFTKYFYPSAKPHLLPFKKSRMLILMQLSESSFNQELLLSYVEACLDDLVDLCWFSDYDSFIKAKTLVKWFLTQRSKASVAVVELLVRSRRCEVPDEAKFRVFDVTVEILETEPALFTQLRNSDLFKFAVTELVNPDDVDVLKKCNYVELLSRIYCILPRECMEWIRGTALLPYLISAIKSEFVDSSVKISLLLLLGEISRSVENKDVLNESNLLQILQEALKPPTSTISTVAFEIACRLISCPLILQKLFLSHQMWLCSMITSLSRKLSSTESLTKPRLIDCVADMFSCKFVSSFNSTSRSGGETIDWAVVFDARMKFLNILGESPSKFLVIQIRNAIPEFQTAGFRLLASICENPWILDMIKSQIEVLKVVIEHPVKGSLTHDCLLLRFHAVKSLLAHQNAIRKIDSDSFVKLRQIAESGPFLAYTVTAPVQVATEAT